MSDKVASQLAQETIYKRVRLGLTPEGMDQLELIEPSTRCLQAAGVAKRLEKKVCTMTWSDHFNSQRYTEHHAKPRATPRQAYALFAENVEVPIGSGYCKSLDIACIPHSRFWVIPPISIPFHTDLFAGPPQWRRSHPCWFTRILDANNGRKIAVSCIGWTQCPEELWWVEPN